MSYTGDTARDRALLERAMKLRETDRELWDFLGESASLATIRELVAIGKLRLQDGDRTLTEGLRYARATATHPGSANTH